MIRVLENTMKPRLCVHYVRTKRRLRLLRSGTRFVLRTSTLDFAVFKP